MTTTTADGNRGNSKNPFGLPWRFGAVPDERNVWHGWMFDCNGNPVTADNNTVKLIVESVNAQNVRPKEEPLV